MRSFDERRAEIFARSENRIKKRNRIRKSIIAVCVPLCLAVTVCSAVLLPQMRHKGIADTSDKTSSYELLVETEDFERVTIINSVKATQLKTVENREKIGEIYTEISDLYHNVSAGTGVFDDYEVNQDHIQSNFNGNQDKPQDDARDETQLKGEQTKGDATDENYTAESSNSKTAYTICFTFGDGSELKYELKNNELLNLNNNSRVRLNDEQVKELLQILEIEE